MQLTGLANGSRIHRGWYLSSLLDASLHAATLSSGFSEAPVAAATISAGTSFDFAPDGRIFICEQAGAVRVIKNGVLWAMPFTTFSVDSTGERGLLGIAFGPDFAANQHVYFYYTVSGAPKHNRVVRVTASGDTMLPNSETLIFRMNGLTAATNHNGRAIHFGADSKLYIAVGENATSANSQILDNMMEMDARSPVSFVLDSSGCWMRMEIISSMEREWGKTWHWRLAGSRRTNPS